jgi:hypothetical protein
LALWLLVATSASIGGFSQSQPTDFGSMAATVEPIILWSTHHKWLAPLLTLCIGLVAFVKKEIGDPWIWESIKHALDQMQEYAFEEQNVGGRHRNRVTLFKRVKWKWSTEKGSNKIFKVRKPWGGWLVPIARSGHVTQKASVIFRASDDPNEAEGVAGQAWVLNAVVVRENLPNVNCRCTDDEITEYARKTWVSVEWLRIEKSTARALIGIPVNVKGGVWGVIVVDSQSPTIENQNQIIESYRLTASILGKLLERV